MPRYLCYCPDYPNNLEKRLSVREAHLAMGQADKESGAQIFGSPFLPQPDTPARLNPPADKPNLAGSVMVYTMPSLEAMWDRLKRDPYWQAGVWDQERLTVEELYN